jgi:hypothetical protein
VDVKDFISQGRRVGGREEEREREKGREREREREREKRKSKSKLISRAMNALSPTC